jgi:hypothetical protein
MTGPGVILTNSEMTDFDMCKRRWYLKHYLRLRPIREHHDYFDVGNLIHAALEQHYDPEGGGNPAHALLVRARKMVEADPENAEAIADNAQLAAIMLEGYLEWLEEQGIDADLDVYASEETLEVELPNYHVLRGKLDARAHQRSTGLKVFLEHKSVQSLGDLPNRAQTNRQFKTYFLLEMLAGGERTDAVLLNMLRKVKRTARAKPPFYGRHPVRFNIEEIRAHWLHVVALSEEMDKVRARLDGGESHQTVCPPTPESCCGGRMSATFRAVCPMMDDGSDYQAMLDEQYEEHDPLERYDETKEDE